MELLVFHICERMLARLALLLSWSTTFCLTVNNGRPKDLPSINSDCLADFGDDQIYVDKTRPILELIQSNERYFFLSRPKRFGKTLLLKTVRDIFAGNANLFKNTYIHKSSYKWPKRPVVLLNFDSFRYDSPSSLMSDLINELLESAKLPRDSKDLNLPSMKNKVVEIMKTMYKKSDKHQVVVLIDEYDAPFRNKYSERSDRDKVEEILRVLRCFLHSLVEARDYVRFCLVTGVTRVGLMDFLSSPDGAYDLTFDPNFPGIVGFTEDELRLNFDSFVKEIAMHRVLSNNSIEVELEKYYIYKEMRYLYSGYRFTHEQVKIYNPSLVVLYLKNKGEMTDFWNSSSGNTQFLRVKIAESPQYVRNRIKRIERNPLWVEEGVLKGCIDDERNGTDLHLLMFQTAFLTIKNRMFDRDTKRFSYELDFPNQQSEKQYLEDLSGLGLDRKQKEHLNLY